MVPRGGGGEEGGEAALDGVGGALLQEGLARDAEDRARGAAELRRGAGERRRACGIEAGALEGTESHLNSPP